MNFIFSKLQENSDQFFGQVGVIALEVVGIVIATYLTYFLILTFVKIFAKGIKAKIPKESWQLAQTLVMPLIASAYLLFFHLLGEQISLEVFYPVLLLKLIFLWLTFRLIRFYPKKNYFLYLIALNLSLLLFLEVFKSLDFSFSFGSISFSLGRIATALLLISIVFWLANFLSSVVKGAIDKKLEIEKDTKSLLRKIVDIALYSLLVLLVLEVLGINLSSFAFIGGALGVGIGFGLQKITSNFISGIILLLDRSIGEGNLIEIDGGPYGFIRSIGSRSTLIECFDGKEVLVPNENLITQKVTNWTFSNKQGRVDFVVGVSYDSDIAFVKELLEETLAASPLVSASKPSMVFLKEFGESSVDFLIFFWVDKVDEGRIKPKSDVLLAIWKKLKENNIEIPYPQRDVHLK